MKDTIIFDLDGTLLNTLEDLKDSTNFALSKFDYQQKSLEEVRQFVGNGVAKLIERAIPNGKNNTNFDECLKIFKENYAKNMYNKTAPYDGIIDMLKELRANNIKTAVVSNKFDLAVKELCKKYFTGLIDTAIGESENVRKKPAPDSVFKAMEELKSPREKCIYVGDSDVDLQTAKNTGIECISVTWGFRDKEFLTKEGATVFANRPDEIIKIIKKSE